jgi:SAM-dependent methyltransferase
MTDPQDVNANQLAFWNGRGGHVWVGRQAHTDAVLAPVSEALLALAAPLPGERVLDVGCGCGASTLELARAVGPEGQVVALDISGPMLDEARRRAQEARVSHVAWRQADAATAALDPFDLLVSNFGLMFFGDPEAAFAHLRGAAAPGARLAFVSWQALPQNPWLQVPMQAVAPHVPPRPPTTPHSPGMFALADAERVSQLLTGAGWASPTIDALEVELDIAAGRGLEEAVTQTTQIGAINSWLRDQPAETVAAAKASLRQALRPYAKGASVRLPGAVWLVSSVAG